MDRSPGRFFRPIPETAPHGKDSMTPPVVPTERSTREPSAPRVLVLGAHPDDAEFFAGGLLHAHRNQGGTLRIISVTNGQSGHHEMPSDALVARRRTEAARSGSVLQSDYVTWDYPDGSLQPTLDVRESIIREIRTFRPDLVLTHRPFDYHPDHRAVGQAVQDASYMVMVPKIVPGYPPPSQEPIVAYMVDLFSRPAPFRPDTVLDASHYLENVLDMLACHESQFFEWMPWIDRTAHTMPNMLGMSEAERTLALRNWLRDWYLERTALRGDRFWNRAWGEQPTLVEAYEISEYAGKPSRERLASLFPKCQFV
jgi:LmbE family N-acetylglucosaminyl deacetylase